MNKYLLDVVAMLSVTLVIGADWAIAGPETGRDARTPGKGGAGASANDQRSLRQERRGRTDGTSQRDIALHFKGLIDGSERIEISSTHAYWHHVNWGWPSEPVTLNDVQWNPQTQAALPNQGRTCFLAVEVDFQSARLERIQGRDTVVLQKRPDSICVCINDTPNGDSLYEFEVVFKQSFRRTTLRIVADIDGSDQLQLDAEGAGWVHGHWQWPKAVRLNDIKWRPRQNPQLSNKGKTAFLDGPVDFASAKLTINKARDMAVLEHTGDGLVVHFADNPLGSATYDLTISFGE